MVRQMSPAAVASTGRNKILVVNWRQHESGKVCVREFQILIGKSWGHHESGKVTSSKSQRASLVVTVTSNVGLGSPIGSYSKPQTIHVHFRVR
jgi:hypothetical protein